jgi:tetratricopeptide (TPR) repeat protein
MASRGPNPYEYDAALSFAGNDRKTAERLAKELKARGVRVFYDRDHLPDLWGKRQSDFEAIFGPKSRFVIPLISKHYARKEWTRLEFESAKREARRREDEFILPIRLDDTLLLGLSDDQVYLRLGALTVREIAEVFARKCGRRGAARQPDATGIRPLRQLSLLSQTTRQALGLLATSCGLNSVKHFRELFPEIGWRSECPRLAKVGLINKSAGWIRVPLRVGRFFEKEPDWPQFNERWIAALTQLKDYFDIAPFLALHYFLAGRDEDCVNTLADVAEGPSLGSWNEVYLGILAPLASSHRAVRLSVEVRCRLYNTTGICLSHAGRYDEAFKWFSKLQAESRRSGNRNWRGQSHLNIGIVCFSQGNRERAIQHYRQAIQCGHGTRDDRLTARAEGNLAVLIAEQSPSEAIQLLKDSIARKQKMGDTVGVATACGQMGQVMALLNHADEALEHLGKAKELAEKTGDAYALELTLQNIGSVHFNAGRLKKALPYYKRAYRLACKHGYIAPQLLAAMCEARTYYEMRLYGEATKAFGATLALAVKADDSESEMSSLHSLGVLWILRGRPSRGRALLQRALEKARISKDSGWISRCHTDGSRRVVHGGFSGFDLDRVERAARTEQRLGNWGAAGRLWATYMDASISCAADPASTNRAYALSVACFEKAKGAIQDILQVLTKFYIWLWGTREYSRALEILSKIEALALDAHRTEDEVKAIDERGVCLQKLARYGEAVRLHRRSTRRARNLPNKEHLARSLNNLGEALRNLEKHDQAIRGFQEAEKIALTLGDTEAALSIAGNRALVLLAKGSVGEARRLLRKCRDTGRRHGYWREYSLFEARLAELAWDEERLDAARRGFERAISEAKSHNQQDVLPRIVLSYSRLLLSLDDSRAALQELRQYENVSPDEPYPYLFHYTLGELYRQTNDLATAERHLRSAKSSATAAQDRDYVAMCAAMLAEIHEERREYAAAEDELRTALSNEPEAEGRAFLLAQVLRVQLSSRSAQKAGATFNEVRKIALDLKLQGLLVDVHAMIGRYEWERGEARRLEGMKACALALVYAVGIDLQSYWSIAVDIVCTLVRPGRQPAPGDDRMTVLLTQLQEWVPREVTSDRRSIQLITWPFVLAKRLLPFGDRPRELGAELRRLWNSRELDLNCWDQRCGNSPQRPVVRVAS